MVSKTVSKKSIEERAQEALLHAETVRDQGKNWVEANNELFGVEGKITQLFPTQAERLAFSNTEQSKAVWKLLEGLRVPTTKRGGSAVRLPEEVSGKFLVRVPRSLHAALVAEAEAEGVSLNQLCLAKLAVQLRSLIH